MPRNPVEPCADCGLPKLIVDREASDLICDTGETLVTLAVPQKAAIHAAMAISARVRAEGAKDERDVLIRELTDGLLLAMEVLSRIVIYGIDGTGDNDADDVDFERALDVAHDLVCAFPCDMGRSAFTDVQIDVSNVLCVFDPDDESETVRFYPTPTPIEA